MRKRGKPPNDNHTDQREVFMNAVKKALDAFLYWITVTLFALLVIFVVWQVVSRQLLGSPATWTEEAARMMFVWLGLFAAALVFGERGHIAVELLARVLPQRVEKGLAIVVQTIIGLFAVVVMIWGGILITQAGWTQQLGALPFTFGHMYLALPVAGVLFLFYAVYYLLSLANGSVPFYAELEESVDPEVRPERLSTQTRLIRGERKDV